MPIPYGPFDIPIVRLRSRTGTGLTLFERLCELRRPLR
jgi:hypothetical protein